MSFLVLRKSVEQVTTQLRGLQGALGEIGGEVTAARPGGGSSPTVDPEKERKLARLYAELAEAEKAYENAKEQGAPANVLAERVDHIAHIKGQIAKLEGGSVGSSDDGSGGTVSREDWLAQNAPSGPSRALMTVKATIVATREMVAEMEGVARQVREVTNATTEAIDEQTRRLIQFYQENRFGYLLAEYLKLANALRESKGSTNIQTTAYIMQQLQGIEALLMKWGGKEFGLQFNQLRNMPAHKLEALLAILAKFKGGAFGIGSTQFGVGDSLTQYQDWVKQMEEERKRGGD